MKEILTHTTPWMDFEDLMLSEANTSQRDKIRTTALP